MAKHNKSRTDARIQCDELPPLLARMAIGPQPIRLFPLEKAPSIDDPHYGRRHAIITGEAGAYLVLSRLLSWKVPASVAMAGLAYDLLADTATFGIIRIQVKTSARSVSGRYDFHMTRGFHGSARGVFEYADNDFDVCGFVCLPINRVIFCAGPMAKFSVKRHTYMSPDFERASWDIALQSVRERQKRVTFPPTLNNRAISKKLRHGSITP